MRSYDIAIASLTIDAPAKWTDNLLSQHAVSYTHLTLPTNREV